MTMLDDDSCEDRSDTSIPARRPVAGWEGAYEVDDQGTVRSLDRLVRRSSDTMRVRGRILRPGVSRSGYLSVTLGAPSGQYMRFVHRLIAEAFLGPCPDGMEVCHGPGGKLDNRLVNLRYATHSDNERDKERDGVCYQRNKLVCPRAHRLQAPNLVSGSAGETSRRRCLACARARAAIRWWRGRGVELDLQAEADRRYAVIMATAPMVTERTSAAEEVARA